MSAGQQAAAGCCASGAPGAIQALPANSVGAGLAANCIINANGQLTYNVNTTTPWVLPASSTFAAYYQVMAHKNSGTLAAGSSALDTWLDCSTGPFWGVVTPNALNLTVSFREKASLISRGSSTMALTP